MKQLKLDLPIPEGYELIFRPWTTTRNGKRIWAKHYGLRAFPMIVAKR